MGQVLPFGGPCVLVRAPAKANLFLAIRGRRPDGYHELVTVLQSMSLYDHLRVWIAGPPGQGEHPAARMRMRVRLIHDAGPDVPGDQDNLAIRAARALGHVAKVLDLDIVDEEEAQRAYQPGSVPVTMMDLEKRIPVAGGMAGGSADAAAALIGLNELWGCYLSRESLKAVGSALGTDVPFCVIGGTALGTGRGITLAQVLCAGTFWWVVCQAREPLSTADVYRAWDRECAPSALEPDRVITALRTRDARALGAALHNDLELAAFALRPELADAKAQLIDAGALGAVLSGSGPTLLALCESEEAAHALASSVAGRFRSVSVVRSPAGGPEVTPC
ncbi:MAG: 4-(cytidine 5'-diphospho)-2-C-methyl-D-erythritol kinase [Egibacteraceae bacterium]